MSRLFAIPPWPEVRRRLLPLVAGLVLCGVAFGSIVQADLGLDPWNVLHQGLADRTGIRIGTVSILVGLVVVLAWIPLRQRLGIGTVLNAIVIGAVMDLVMPLLPEPGDARTQWLLLLVGLALAGLGVGMYIGARLGPGPRDGIMTGLAERGPSIRLVRTGIELAALAVGIVLGGSVGIGTILFALTIGPNTQFWLERLDLGHPPGFEPQLDVEVDPDPDPRRQLIARSPADRIEQAGRPRPPWRRRRRGGRRCRGARRRGCGRSDPTAGRSTWGG